MWLDLLLDIKDGCDFFCGRDEGPKKWKRIKSIKGGKRQSLDPNSASNVTQNRAGGENT